MSKEKEEKEVKEELLDLNAPVALTASDLLKVITLMSKENASVLAEAFEKMTPGYKTPGQKENEASLKQSSKEMEIFKLKNRRRQQKLCDHEIGQTGRRRLGEGAFFMLKLPTGESIGVCTYCLMTISSANPDHYKFFRKAGGTMAEAGQFNLNDPIKAQLARLGPDERERVLAARRIHEATSPVAVEEDDYI